MPRYTCMSKISHRSEVYGRPTKRNEIAMPRSYGRLTATQDSIEMVSCCESPDDHRWLRPDGAVKRGPYTTGQSIEAEEMSFHAEAVALTEAPDFGPSNVRNAQGSPMLSTQRSMRLCHIDKSISSLLGIDIHA